MRNDPIESLLAEAMDSAGIRYERGNHDQRLDFYLPEYQIYIECKVFYTQRSFEQIQTQPNVVLIQGKEAAWWLATLIKGNQC